MPRAGLIPLSLLVALAGSAITPAAAPAAACTKTAGTKFALCLGEPLVLTEGTLTVHGETDGTSGYILKTPDVTVSCSTGQGVGALAATSGKVTVLGIVVKFSSCTVQLPAACKIKEPIVTEPLKGVIEELRKEKILFTPETGENFTELTFENKGSEECLIAGKDRINLLSGGKGGVLCTSPLEVTRLLQLFTCLKGNSDLEFKKEVATFEGDFNAKLLSKAGTEQKWAVIEGT